MKANEGVEKVMQEIDDAARESVNGGYEMTERTYVARKRSIVVWLAVIALIWIDFVSIFYLLAEGEYPPTAYLPWVNLFSFCNSKGMDSFLLLIDVTFPRTTL